MDLLDGYFEVHKAEVMRSILTEFNKRNYDWNRRMEGYEEGIHDKAVETARNMLAKGIPVDVIAECTGLPLEEVAALQTEMTETVK